MPITSNYQVYVLGFAFRKNDSEVCLIHKLRPEWQAGKLNGVGGKVEENESPVIAMVREFHEETGIFTSTDSWRHYAVLSGKDWTVYVFETQDVSVEVQSPEAEIVDWYPRIHLNLTEPKTLPNLNWLIPLALDRTAKMAVIEDLT